MRAPDLTFKIPQARESLSFEPAKALVIAVSRQAPTVASSGLIGRKFHEQAMSALIGEVQDALEAYAKLEREQR